MGVRVCDKLPNYAKFTPDAPESLYLCREQVIRDIGPSSSATIDFRMLDNTCSEVTLAELETALDAAAAGLTAAHATYNA